MKKKSQESYIFNQESLASFKVTTNNKFPQVFESNLILMIDWGWFTVCFN